MVRLLLALWIGFFLIQFSGGKIGYYFPALAVLTAGVSSQGPSAQARRTSFIVSIRRWLRPWMIVAYGVMVPVGVFVANILNYEAMNGTLWDLGNYIQPIYTYAKLGAPYSSVSGDYVHPFSLHYSLSVWILGQLYRWISHPWLLLFWQSLFMTLPAWIFVIAFRCVLRRHGLKPEPLGDLLVLSVYFLMPPFTGQLIWPYVYHMPGLFFFAASYLFYYQRRYFAWFVSLVLFVLHKQEFGIFAALVAAAFGGEALLSGRKQEDRFKIAVLAAAVTVGGIGFYFWYMSQAPRVVTWGERFGNLGGTPGEALVGFFKTPGIYLRGLGQVEALKFLAFFLVCGLGWLVRSWRAHKYFLPMLPLLLLCCFSDSDVLHRLYYHYCWPFAIALVAMLVIGVTDVVVAKTKNPLHAYAHLCLALFLFSLWGMANPFRPIKTNYRDWVRRSEERQALAFLKTDRETVLCCEDRLCTLFADRPLLLPAKKCLEGSPLLDEYKGREARLLLYAESQPVPPVGSGPSLGHITVQNNWEFTSEFLKLSPRIRVQ